MIVHVWRRAQEADLGPVIVACGDEAIAEAVRGAGGMAVIDAGRPALRLRPGACRGGGDRPRPGNTTRSSTSRATLPTVSPDARARRAGAAAPRPTASTSARSRWKSPAGPTPADPNVVKAVVEMADGARIGRALYFTRAPAPSGRRPALPPTTASTAGGARRWRNSLPCPSSSLERRERLEQLRALAHGLRIDVSVIEEAPQGVDTPADLERVRRPVRRVICWPASLLCRSSRTALMGRSGTLTIRCVPPAACRTAPVAAPGQRPWRSWLAPDDRRPLGRPADPTPFPPAPGMLQSRPFPAAKSRFPVTVPPASAADCIAFQGWAGANSGHGLPPPSIRRMTPLPCASFEETIAAVHDGRAAAGDESPIENSVAGRVADIHHLLPSSGLHIVAEHFQPVRHQLPGPEGAELGHLKRVHSHVQALGQCRAFIRKIGGRAAGRRRHRRRRQAGRRMGRPDPGRDRQHPGGGDLRARHPRPRHRGRGAQHHPLRGHGGRAGVAGRGPGGGGRARGDHQLRLRGAQRARGALQGAGRLRDQWRQHDQARELHGRRAVRPGAVLRRRGGAPGPARPALCVRGAGVLLQETSRSSGSIRPIRSAATPARMPATTERQAGTGATSAGGGWRTVSSTRAPAARKIRIVAMPARWLSNSAVAAPKASGPTKVVDLPARA